MTVKSSRKQAEEEAETVETANLLMLLSRVGESTETATTLTTTTSSTPPSWGRVFQCNTCNKQFHTFQALGGHRASHKKLKQMADLFTQPHNSAHRKPKKHECPICGLEFALGQALGGHMKRHRAAMEEGRRVTDKLEVHEILVPVLKRSSSRKRVFGLDLNLSPYENDL